MKGHRNPFEMTGKWYKANFHAHTTESDGKLTPAEYVETYRKGGYQILALTDHRVTNDIKGLSDKRILVISGMEHHPLRSTTKAPFHLIALNVPHGFQFGEKEKNHANRCISKVKRLGGETILGHPYWCGQSYNDFKHLKGLAAIEVFNTVCERVGRGSSESEWAHAIEDGMALPCVAVDDTHLKSGPEICYSYTMVKMRSLTVKNILRAIQTGHCYASQGPEIKYFGIKGGELCLNCSPVAKIQFMGGPAVGANRIATDSQSIRSYTIDTPSWDYARAVVTDTAGKKAWTNPINLSPTRQA